MDAEPVVMKPVPIDRALDQVGVSASYGFGALDRLTGGLHPGSLILVAGRPGMGKTSFATSLVRNLVHAGASTLFATPLRRRSDAALDLVAAASGIDRRSLERRRDDEAVRRTEDRLRAARLAISDRADLTVESLAIDARAIPDLDALVIDDLEPLARAAKAPVPDVMLGLRALARELDVPVVATLSLPREPADVEPDFRPRLSEIPGDDETVRACEVVILLHDARYYLTVEDASRVAPEVDLVVVRNVHGDTDAIRLPWSGATRSVG